MVVYCFFDEVCGFGVGQVIFGLVLELWFVDEDVEYQFVVDYYVVGGNIFGFFVVDEVVECVKFLYESLVQVLFVGVVIGGWNGVVILVV